MSKEPYEEYPIDAAVLKLRMKGAETLSLRELEAALMATDEVLFPNERLAAKDSLIRLRTEE